MADGIKETLEGVLDELSGLYDRIDETQVDKLVKALLEERGIFIAGAGRSGLLLRCFAMRLMHMGKKAHMTGDVATPGARPGDMLLIGSGSGETGSLVSIAKKAKSMGMTIAAVTTNPDSTIGKMADLVVVLPGPTPKNAETADPARSVQSAQPMGSLFEQGMFLMLDCIIMKLMKKKNVTSEEMFRRHANLE